MRFVRRLLAGIKSLFAAVLTAGASFVPAWYAHEAIERGIAPVWVYGCIAVLVLVSGSIVLAFVAKAWQGIGPLDD